MARGSKEKYTEKQKRQAEHIEEGYERRGVSDQEAERRASALTCQTAERKRVRISPPRAFLVSLSVVGRRN